MKNRYRSYEWAAKMGLRVGVLVPLIIGIYILCVEPYYLKNTGVLFTIGFAMLGGGLVGGALGGTFHWVVNKVLGWPKQNEVKTTPAKLHTATSKDIVKETIE